MRNFALLLANICLFIMMPSCAPHPINSISSTMTQPFDNPCLEGNSSHSNIHILPTDIANLTVSAIRSEIISYLDSGGSASGLQPLIVDDQNNMIGSVVEIDLNKDGIKEIVLSTTTASEYKAGWVGVYECQMGKYSVSYAELGEYIDYAKVNTVLDLLNTGSPQIYEEYKWDGGGCLVGLQVLAFSSGEWSWVFGNYLNCPATVSMSVNELTGETEIIYKGFLVDVMGNEPAKEVTQIYTVRNGQFELEP